MDTSLFQRDFTCAPGTSVQVRTLSSGLLGRLARVFLAIVVSFCAYLILAHGVADLYSKRQNSEGFRKAIRWESWNPERYADLARSLERPLKNGDLPEVIRLYEHAVQLSPHDSAYWSRLGQAYDWAGQTADSKSAYERAALLFPSSSAIQWAMGNFYLREGRMDQALPTLQRALLGDPDLRRPAFDLAWRATGDTELIAREMIPHRPDIFFEYLNYLIGIQRLDDATKVWDRMTTLDLRLEPRAAIPYLDALIEHRKIDRLISAKSDLLKRIPRIIGKSQPDADFITNGDFENEILDGGLDWRLNRMPGATFSLDNQTFFGGTHSLQIRFEGTENLSDVLVFQYVPVKPSTTYRLTGYMRAQEITTDSGPRFQIRDADDPATRTSQSEAVVGNFPWVRRQLDFKSGTRTSLLEIRVVRLPSLKFENRIAGTAWVDQVTLAAIE